ncbi:MAG TPA: SIS domain-containing protein [Caulobacteraceae bacterium]|jgi:glucosamine--fructose-6-phosphate aminotransferase (isomerizing)|nr:SIS domain-containing protein [Caulobacteraceae bacterium]
MFIEAAEAASVVRRELGDNHMAMARLGQTLRALRPRAVVTCARGSSDHAATFARYLIETRLGIMTSSAAPSVSSIYASTPELKGAVCLAISQSGRSPDLLASVEAAKAGGAFIVAMVNVEDSPLAALADEVAPLRAGPELGVAATKSYIATLACIAQLIGCWTGDDDLLAALGGLPERLDEAWKLDWSEAIKPLREARNLYVIGRGVGFAIAQEAALKLKETCGLHAEAFSAAEVRHGPMTLVEDGFPVLVFSLDDEARAGIDDLVAEFADRGAQVLLAGPPRADAARRGVRILPSLTAHPVLEPLLLVQSFYRMANQLSILRGFDPDHPAHLNKVTETF